MLLMFIMAKPKPVEEDVKVKCSMCGKYASSVYLCRERNKIYCPECHNGSYINDDGKVIPNIRIDRCPHERGEHMHILVPGIKNKNEAYIEEVLQISKQNEYREN